MDSSRIDVSLRFRWSHPSLRWVNEACTAVDTQVPLCAKENLLAAKDCAAPKGLVTVRSESNGRGEESVMVTWVLTEEPDELVARAIEIVEARLGSDEEVMWLAPGPVAEPVQD
jgi:hypothetical protein